MKRRLTQLAAVFAVVVAGSPHAAWQARTQGNTPYQLWVPANYSASSKYPLVLHLYPAGSRGTDGKGELICQKLTSAEVQNTTPCFLVVPRCETNQKWADMDWAQCYYSTTTVPISNEMQNTISAIRGLFTEFPGIDTNRVHVCGGSMGGVGTWDAITRNPGLFASATPLSGAGDTTKTGPVIHVATWSFVKNGDQITPDCGPVNMITSIRAKGGLPKFTRFDEGQYHLWDQIWNPGDIMYTPEQVPWMLRQVKSTAVPAKVTGLTATAQGSYQVNLSWQAANDAVGDPLRIHYQVYRGTTLVATTDSLAYADTSFALQENANVSYTVKAYNDNSYVGPASDAASATMPADNTPPAILDAMDIGDSTAVLVTFTERVDPASAQTTGNYSISPSLAISGAALQTGNKAVKLTVAKMTLHQSYTVTVNNVKDRTGHNTIAANSTAQFSYDYIHGLKYEYFEFATYPTSTADMDNATPIRTGMSEWMGLAPSHREDRYGFRMSGAIVALEPGRYTFSTNSQQGTRLYVDGTLVVDNDYAPGYVAGSINLTRGKHSVLALYYATGSTCVWESRWEGPGHPRQVFFPWELMHNPDAPAPTPSLPHAATGTSRLSLTASSVAGDTRIAFSLPQASKVRLAVYDLRGRLVRTVVNGARDAGIHTVVLREPCGLSRGQYLVRLRTPAGETSRRFAVTQ